MRKGVMDTPLRASVSLDVNIRFMDDLATMQKKTPVLELMNDLTVHIIKNRRHFHSLDPAGKDRELLLAHGDPTFMISRLNNKMLQERLRETPFGTGRTEKQLSAKISRHLRLLRVHGIIKKIQNQNRYQVTLKGKRLTSALSTLLAVSIENLLKMAA